MTQPTGNPTVDMLYAELNKCREENTRLRAELLELKHHELFQKLRCCDPIQAFEMACNNCGKVVSYVGMSPRTCKEPCRWCGKFDWGEARKP